MHVWDTRRNNHKGIRLTRFEGAVEHPLSHSFGSRS